MKFVLFGLGCVLLLSAAETRHKVERVKVHGRSLEGNLSGDSPDRDVSIYLPASYQTSKRQRYPVLYFLHGFTDDDSRWFGFQKHWINLPEVIDNALANPAVREMIVVMPNAFTRFQGSMYSSSVTIGNWEEFVARELVTYMDSHYRTLAVTASRGLAGHSMGGYGTVRIAMKNPGVFSSIYLLNPCCMTAPSGSPPQNAASLEAIKTTEDIAKASFGTKAQLASAAAWAPNPKKPPFFLDLPTDAGVQAKFAANAPLAIIDQYVSNLRRLTAIGFDAGDEERGIAPTTKTLDEVLTNYGIKHQFEIYPGNHTNRVAERIEKQVLPFFSQHLKFEKRR